MSWTMWVIVAVGVVLAVLGAILSLRIHSAPPEPPSPAVLEERAVESAEGPVAVPLSPALEPGEPEVQARHLRVRLTGFEPATGMARLRVRAVMGMRGRRPDDLTGTSDPEGRFDLDLAPLFEAAVPAELSVRVDHPDCRSATARLRVEGEGDLTVEIPLTRAAILEGEVSGTEGRPVVATVALFPLEDGAPTERPVDETTSARDGKYRLRGGDGPHLVVAVSDHHAPASFVIAPVLDRLTMHPILVLGAGVEVRGHVLDHMDEPVAGARGRAEFSAEGHGIRIGGVRLVYRDGRVRKGSIPFVTDAEGRFLVGGLGKATWRVKVDDVPGVRLLSGLSSRLAREVSPPAELVIRISAARLVLRVTGRGKPLDSFGANIRSERGMSGHFFRAGDEPVLLMAPGVEHEITISARGFERHEATITSPAAGSDSVHEIDLVPLPPRPSLVVAFTSPRPIRRSSFGLYKAGSVRGEMPNLLRTDEEAGEDGRFRLERLLPGRYVLVAKPENTWFEARGHYLPAEQEVVLPERGEVAVTLEAVLGGRIRISARDGSGKAVAARCRVTDERGGALSVRFMAEGAHGVSWSDEEIVKGVANVVAPALPSGRYRVELSLEGHHPWTGEVTVEEGRTAAVEGILTPR